VCWPSRSSFILVGHPTGSSRLQALSPSFRSYCYDRQAPALVSFAPLQSSCFKAPVGGFRPSLLGFAPVVPFAADIAAVALVFNRTFRPSIDLFPGVHSRADIAALASVTRCQPRDLVPTSPFCTVPPVFSADRPTCVELCALAGAGFAGLLHPAADPGVRCVSCVFRVTLTPQTGHCWSTCCQARENRFLAARFIPFEECPSPAAVPRRRDRCPRGVCFPQSLNRPVASVAGFDARVRAS